MTKKKDTEPDVAKPKVEKVQVQNKQERMEKRMLKEADLYDKSQAHLDDEDIKHNLISSLKASKRTVRVKSTNEKSIYETA